MVAAENADCNSEIVVVARKYFLIKQFIRFCTKTFPNKCYQGIIFVSSSSEQLWWNQSKKDLQKNPAKEIKTNIHKTVIEFNYRLQKTKKLWILFKTSFIKIRFTAHLTQSFKHKNKTKNNKSYVWKNLEN